MIGCLAIALQAILVTAHSLTYAATVVRAEPPAFCSLPHRRRRKKLMGSEIG